MGWTPLRTKLQAPPARGLVERPRLWAALDRAWSHPLTLLCAPAGAGKTALAAGWAARERAAGRAVGWLTLDAGDSDPATLARYLMAALRSCAPGAAALDAAGLAADPDPDALINALAGLPGEVALVVEGIHLAEGPGAGRLLARLVDYMPAGVHLVLTARREPDLPLARWRAGGQLWEVGLAELRLTAAEARELVRLAAGLELSEAAAAALAARTQGWAAAIHLAALALRGQPDPDSAAAALRGTQR
jgi:LuxR family maltose regulon positive regulatory protein